MIVCKFCNCEKEEIEFYSRDGRVQYRKCKSCIFESNHNRYFNEGGKEKHSDYIKKWAEKNKENLQVYKRDYYETQKGRVKSILKTAKRRSTKFNEETDLTEEFLNDLISKNNNRCALSGIEFDYGKKDGMKCNPFAPSIDRIDSNKGYTRDNVRIVCWQVNLMKGEITDDELKKFCQAILDGR